MRKTIFGLMVALATAFSAAPFQSFASSVVDLSNPGFVQVTGPTSIPIGHAQFCKTHRSECRPNAKVVATEVLTDRSWNQLVGINTRVNEQVIPETDEDLYHVAEYWTYPDGRGDCEDIALEKRRELIAKGWDASTLLMTVVRQKSGEGHAVLMVRTDRGDLVLDNQDMRILVWNQTPYEFIKRQSQTDAGQWVGLADNRGIIVAANN